MERALNAVALVLIIIGGLNLGPRRVSSTSTSSRRSSGSTPGSPTSSTSSSALAAIYSFILLRPVTSDHATKRPRALTGTTRPLPAHVGRGAPPGGPT